MPWAVGRGSRVSWFHLNVVCKSDGHHQDGVKAIGGGERPHKVHSELVESSFGDRHGMKKPGWGLGG
jgi:hypothetical protein